jgi:Cytochrome P460
MEELMKEIACLVIAVAPVAGVGAYPAPASGQADGEASPIYGVTIPAGYRHWSLISVSHLAAGSQNQIRAQLGNDIAMKAYREGKLPFPDGAIIAALHWNCVPSEESSKVLAPAGAQSSVPDPL